MTEGFLVFLVLLAGYTAGCYWMGYLVTKSLIDHPMSPNGVRDVDG